MDIVLLTNVTNASPFFWNCWLKNYFSNNPECFETNYCALKIKFICRISFGIILIYFLKVQNENAMV